MAPNPFLFLGVLASWRFPSTGAREVRRFVSPRLRSHTVLTARGLAGITAPLFEATAAVGPDAPDVPLKWAP